MTIASSRWICARRVRTHGDLQPASIRGRAVDAAFILVALGYLAGLGVRPLIAPDELRYAEAAREMLASGDWIVPHLAGVVYFEKPILGYWATALSLALFGENAVAVRLPFALATLGMAAIVWGLVRRFGPEPLRRGSWASAAGLAFLTSAGVAAIGTAAVFDPLFAFALSAALAAFFVATQHPPGRARRTWLSLCGIACGLAFLTKGFLAVAIPVCVAGPFLLLSGRAREAPGLAAIPALVALLTALPWSLAIAWREPAYWEYFVVHEHLQRFAGGVVAQHGEPFWFYAPVLLVGALPWTPLFAWVARREVFDTPLARFAAAWAIGPLLLLSLSTGKLPTYALPCFPPLFVLLAMAAARRSEADRAAGLRRLAMGFACLLAVGGLALLSPLPDALGLGTALGESADGLETAWAVGLLLAAGTASLGVRALSSARRLVALAFATVMVFGTIVAFFPVGIVHKTPVAWLRDHVRSVPADAILIAHRSLAYSLCWLLQRDDVLVLGHGGELAYGLARPEQQHRLLLEPEQLDAILRDPQRHRPVLVAALTDRFELPERPEPSRLEISPTVELAEYPPVSREGAEPLQ
jgi:4-amino-4-deoxy-L-arabinose transferase